MTKDSQHPFFRPVWRRYAVIAVALVWAAAEWIGGSPMWGSIAIAMAIYGYWSLILNYEGGKAENGATPDAPKQSQDSKEQE
ncbi:hypothetical protein HDIA_1147 [Hartmannibacter diazotrophicus]|uniref:DUF3329 domain-containing protein n=1 Tax=Hartmannibacter diazotrophicus TaxID=1482074 RepID=A0A2C9D3F2_9HYPH|nr:hypothetical protein [Hartmannibacter diazotrophicus]SON54688.1 hypothetical protein HDIA_1147 [Hartmannibacter diazotrophicus]